MKTETTDVLIAGGGPVGLTAALCLQAHGIHSMVIEAKPRGVTHSYALALHPASLDLLESVGVLDDVLDGTLAVSRVVVQADGRRLASLPVAAQGARHPFLAVTGQDRLESALVRALEARGVHVRWNHRLARFQQHAEGLAAEIDELEERVIGYATARFDWMVRRTHSVDARYLIGADGHGSLVRRQLDIDFPEVAPAEHFAVFEFQVRGSLPDEAVLVLHPEGLAVLWPLPGGRARWSFAVHPRAEGGIGRDKDHEPVQIFGPGAFPALEEQLFERLLAERAPWFTAGVEHVYWRMLVRFERRLADAFGRGRVWLAGDAAHLTGPAGIQSMNVGLREARDLAEALSIDRQRGGTRALEAYQAHALDEWRRLLGLAGSVAVGPGAPKEIAGSVARVLSALPGSGRALAEMAGGLGLTLGG
ncbi:MAG: FAD-dependent monooxygenase [Opitutaceae bacterium]|nr:FAD-dependent monooxygenase [Opitutaceae bacterium]